MLEATPLMNAHGRPNHPPPWEVPWELPRLPTFRDIEAGRKNRQRADGSQGSQGSQGVSGTPPHSAVILAAKWGGVSNARARTLGGRPS